jgi:hypothetical protein
MELPVPSNAPSLRKSGELQTTSPSLRKSGELPSNPSSRNIDISRATTTPASGEAKKGTKDVTKEGTGKTKEKEEESGYVKTGDSIILR